MYTRALYYPGINVESPAWLKTAILYWHRIDTIVPPSILDPYQGRVQKACAEAGILRPYYADYDQEILDRIGKLALTNLSTPAGRALIAGRKGERRVLLHSEKLPYLLKETLAHLERSSDGWLSVGEEFSDYYMTLLASEVAKKVAANPLSGRRLAYDFFNTADQPTAKLHQEAVVATTLVDLMIKGLKLDPSVSIQRIIKFREKRKDELGKLRDEFGRLAKEMKDADPSSVTHLCEDAYSNRVEPSLVALRKTLKDASIPYVIDGFLKICAFSVPPTAAAAVAFSQLTTAVTTTPILLAGGALTLAAMITKRHVEKNEARRKSPYSYLLSLEEFAAASRVPPWERP